MKPLKMIKMLPVLSVVFISFNLLSTQKALAQAGASPKSSIYVSELSLVDITTRTKIGTLGFGPNPIGARSPGNITIEASVSEPASKVTFQILETLEHTENFSPYHANGDFLPVPFAYNKDYTLIVKPFNQAGIEGANSVVQFSLRTGEISLRVSELSLVDILTKTKIAPLVPGVNFIGNRLPANVLVEAKLSESAGKVRFLILGGLDHTENAAPYHINGDWLPVPFTNDKQHTLIVKPYSSTGIEGINTAVTFTLSGGVDKPLPVLSFTPTPLTPTEGDTVLTHVQLSTASSTIVSVAFTVSGTATSPSDHNLLSGTLTFAPGETLSNIRFDTVNDTVVESTETLSITLGSPTGATLGSPSVQTFTLLDDDVVTPVLARYVRFPAGGCDTKAGYRIRVLLNGQPHTQFPEILANDCIKMKVEEAKAGLKVYCHDPLGAKLDSDLTQTVEDLGEDTQACARFLN